MPCLVRPSVCPHLCRSQEEHDEHDANTQKYKSRLQSLETELSEGVAIAGRLAAGRLAAAKMGIRDPEERDATYSRLPDPSMFNKRVGDRVGDRWSQYKCIINPSRCHYGCQSLAQHQVAGPSMVSGSFGGGSKKRKTKKRKTKKRKSKKRKSKKRRRRR